MAVSVGSVRHVLLTGPPGIGKTTLIHRSCDALLKHGIPTQGFFTEELRVNGKRTGFDVVTLSGQRAPLARIGTDAQSGSRYKVGQYNVCLKDFEQMAMSALHTKAAAEQPFPVIVIDEIGKMELFSDPFKQRVQALFANPHLTVLATIPIAKGRPIPFVEAIRGRKDAKLFEVSPKNRDYILDEIVATVKEAYKNK